VGGQPEGAALEEVGGDEGRPAGAQLVKQMSTDEPAPEGAPSGDNRQLETAEEKPRELESRGAAGSGRRASLAVGEQQRLARREEASCGPSTQLAGQTNGLPLSALDASSSPPDSTALDLPNLGTGAERRQPNERRPSAQAKGEPLPVQEPSVPAPLAQSAGCRLANGGPLAAGAGERPEGERRDHSAGQQATTRRLSAAASGPELISNHEEPKPAEPERPHLAARTLTGPSGQANSPAATDNSPPMASPTAYQQHQAAPNRPLRQSVSRTVGATKGSMPAERRCRLCWCCCCPCSA